MKGVKPVGPNADQIEFWNSEGGQNFVRHQNALDTMLGPYGLKAMEAGGLKHGNVVLDIGCGCGDSSIEMSRRVGAMGEVVGVDISEMMLQRAEDLAAHQELTNTFFELADVEVDPLHRDSFDLAFSRFGIMFFNDPVAALRNVHRVLHDEGRLAFACWQTLDKSPWIALQMQAVIPLLAEENRPPPADPDAPGPFSFGDPDRLRGVLAEAGFHNVQMDAYAPAVALFGLKDMEEVLDFALEVGPAKGLFAEMDPDTMAMARNAVRDAYAPYLTPDGVIMEAAAWIVTADKTPGS
jgi:ubiquinone/menaquinone biosynthesis C-methylase UbiE